MPVNAFNEVTLGALVDEIVEARGRFMWFLGAGTSRASELPSADDLIWQLKLRYYRENENQRLASHDINNLAIRRRVQDYCDSRGFPAPGTPEEYSFYFDLVFGADQGRQQQFIRDAVDVSKTAMTVGPRVLAALMSQRAAPVVFTTNFDNVVENAFALVAGESISAFHLEGAYAALDALNQERFPLYAKLHGDFRYRSIKNLVADLLENDQQIERCFLSAAARFGMIVAGYSGRDANVMTMMKQALAQPNPFPTGLVWTCTRRSDVSTRVLDFLTDAARQGVRTSLCEVGTYDILMSRIWRHWPDRPVTVESKVRAWRGGVPNIAVPPPGNGYPIIRTNAFEVAGLPAQCGKLVGVPGLDFRTLKDAVWNAKADLVTSFDGEGLFWGDGPTIQGLFSHELARIEDKTFGPVVDFLRSSTTMRGFFEHGIAKALADTGGLALRKRGHSYFVVVGRDANSAPHLKRLRTAVGFRGEAELIGDLPKAQARWAEAVSVRLEVRDEKIWLLLRPEVWITPLSSRESAVDFIKARRRTRYNRQANDILDAWIDVLLGGQARDQLATATAFEGSSYPARFEINPRSAFSGRTVR